jgi:hypothetical protein
MADRTLPLFRRRARTREIEIAQQAHVEQPVETSRSSPANPATTWLLFTGVALLLGFSLAASVFAASRDWISCVMVFGSTFILARLFFAFVLHV